MVHTKADSVVHTGVDNTACTEAGIVVRILGFILGHILRLVLKLVLRLMLGLVLRIISWLVYILAHR